jgi:hypothetical protein
VKQRYQGSFHGKRHGLPVRIKVSAFTNHLSKGSGFPPAEMKDGLAKRQCLASRHGGLKQSSRMDESPMQQIKKKWNIVALKVINSL